MVKIENIFLAIIPFDGSFKICFALCFLQYEFASHAPRKTSKTMIAQIDCTLDFPRHEPKLEFFDILTLMLAS